MKLARDAWGLAKRSIQGWLDDGAGSMGAAVAFYTLFSMAPMILVAIVVAGSVLRPRAGAAAPHLAARGRPGPQGGGGIRFLVQATSNHGRFFPATVGAVTGLVGAATVFNELKTDLDRIWRCHATRPKGFLAVLRKRLLTIVMVVLVALLLLFSLLVSALMSALGEEFFGARIEYLRALEFAGSFLVITGLFATIYKLLPSTRIAWSDVWVGAAVTSMLFWVGKALIAVYLAHNAVGSMYGAAGAIIVLIAWVYYTAQIFFLGAEFTREYALRHGSHQDEPDMPIAHTDGEEVIVERARGS
jgi:Predicted membrane protein